MANQEQLDILKQGVKAWNEWREENLEAQIDLDRAELIGADLRHAILSGANLNGANLSGTNLREADLRGTRLYGAILYGADLTSARLMEAQLVAANLTNARLHFTDLTRVLLPDADLGGAVLGWTNFGDVDLSVVKNLETVQHDGPSIIGIDTIYKSQGKIPEVFLKGAGVDDAFITYIRSLVEKPIEYYSCFISYSSKDDAFAKRLYADLQSHNVRCWFAPEDMKIGDRIRPRIDESIRMYDKLLLVLSEHSVASKWVEFEVEAAMDKEQEGKPSVLFPVRLDNTLMESTTAWAAHIKRTRHIGDFTHWKNHDEYKKAFDRLLRDLKAEAMTG